MMVFFLFILSVVTTLVLADAELHPIETQDLKSIVDSVKRDVDRHLKMTSATSRIQSSLHNPTEYDKSAVVDIDKFMTMIQDSMHHHLVRNLGHPLDTKNGESPMTDALNEAYIADKPLKSAESTSGFSSQIHEIRVGSAKGLPGVHFPDYTDIPRTSFICSDKESLPGFYADLDTGCQVFHVCWPDRKESFLCPMGTIFNQALKVCDYWYNSNCSLAPYYYTVTAGMEPGSPEATGESVGSMIDDLLKKADSDSAPKHSSTKSYPAASSVVSFVSQFMPIKAKIVVYPETANRRSKIITSASIGENKASFKSRSRRKNLGSSKHSRVPRSVDESNTWIDFVRDWFFSFDRMDESHAEVLQFRIAEALDGALTEIRKNKTRSMLFGHVEKFVKFVKKHFLKHDLPESLDLEPGSDLYEYDIELQERYFKYKEGTNALVWLAAGFWYKWDTAGSKSEVAREFEENEASEHAPLMDLNPRFIVEPATEEKSKFLKDESSWHLKSRVERSATVLHPLKFRHKDRLNIYPATKKALLKNYAKLFKTKHA